ncbi:MAG TPA: hypothetical protein VFD48_13460 [Pyrinomonadaceae bacterium]|nr:hypothetical protein [Pyrinomonadaceae bacterium]
MHKADNRNSENLDSNRKLHSETAPSGLENVLTPEIKLRVAAVLQKLSPRPESGSSRATNVL